MDDMDDMGADARELSLDRERIECVFRLGGGELESAPWAGVARCWYAGPPEYAMELKDAHRVDCDACDGTGEVVCTACDREADCDACDSRGYHTHEVRTACHGDMPYGCGGVPEGWEIIGEYPCGGADCWRCGAGCDDDHQAQRAECPLCEGDGYVYLGSAVEIVYRAIEPS